MSGSAAAGGAKDLRVRLRETPIKLDDVRSFLDGLSHTERVAAIRGVGAVEQRRLYEAADGYGELCLHDLVPPTVPEGATVRHFGRNSLPAFTHFEKRMCRPAGQDAVAPEVLWGFNFQALQPITGPGYFIAREDPKHREVLVDYREVPPHAPEGWPTVRPNERGLSRLVYGFMVDTLRRVSEHVSIGSAARRGRDLGSFFLLTREP